MASEDNLAFAVIGSLVIALVLTLSVAFTFYNKEFRRISPAHITKAARLRNTRPIIAKIVSCIPKMRSLAFCLVKDSA